MYTKVRYILKLLLHVIIVLCLMYSSLVQKFCLITKTRGHTLLHFLLVSNSFSPNYTLIRVKRLRNTHHQLWTVRRIIMYLPDHRSSSFVVLQCEDGRCHWCLSFCSLLLSVVFESYNMFLGLSQVARFLSTNRGTQTHCIWNSSWCCNLSWYGTV